MRYALGVDGGATKTHALVVEASGQAIGCAVGGPANHEHVGVEAALREIEHACLAAYADLGISPEIVEFGCFCLAGADLPEDYATLRRGLEALRLTSSLSVKNDTMAALRSGLSRSWGVVVICGTGINAAGRSPDGREIQLPGLGPISGDWGGGGELGQEMIRLVMRAWDGRGKATLLTDMILHALQMPSIETLISKLRYEEIQQRQISDLVPLLFEAARMGDEVAQDLLVRMGTEVGVTALALIRRLSLQDEDVEVVLGGGVFKGKAPIFFETIAQVIRKEAPKAQLVLPHWEPVVGAALLALESLDVPVTEELLRRIGSLLPPNLRLRRDEPSGNEAIGRPV